MDEERQVTIRQPLSRIGWQQVRLFRIVNTEAFQAQSPSSRINIQHDHSTIRNTDENAIPSLSGHQFQDNSVTCSDAKWPLIPIENGHHGGTEIRLSEHHYPSAYAHTLLARCFSSTMPAPQRRQPSTTAATAHAPPLLWAQFFLKEGSHLRRLQPSWRS